MIKKYINRPTPVTGVQLARDASNTVEVIEFLECTGASNIKFYPGHSGITFTKDGRHKFIAAADYVVADQSGCIDVYNEKCFSEVFDEVDPSQE